MAFFHDAWDAANPWLCQEAFFLDVFEEFLHINANLLAASQAFFCFVHGMAVWLGNIFQFNHWNTFLAGAPFYPWSMLQQLQNLVIIWISTSKVEVVFAP